VHRGDNVQRVPRRFRKDHALSRRFQKIDVPEPSIEETVQILRGLKSRFEAHHGVKYSGNALTSAVEPLPRATSNGSAPGRQGDRRDRRRPAAAQKILPSQADEGRGQDEIEEISRRSRGSPGIGVAGRRAALKNLDRDLKAVVFGQDKAIEALVSAIRTARSGLANPQKPIGCFLFSGPRAWARPSSAPARVLHGNRAARFDMSNTWNAMPCRASSGAPRDTSVRPGRPSWTEAVTKKPYAVLLLDEIEKAHPDIFNILLQVMDHGTLTDNNGRKADFPGTFSSG